MPVPGKPVEVLVVNDTSCGQACDIAQPIEGLRNLLTPALVLSLHDRDSEVGEDLIEDFEIQALPAFILGDGIDLVKGPRGGNFVQEAAMVLKEKDGKYLIDSPQFGFRYGKFITPPLWADPDSALRDRKRPGPCLPPHRARWPRV